MPLLTWRFPVAIDAISKSPLIKLFLSLGRHFVILTIWGLINMFFVLWRLSVWNCQIDLETFLLRAVHNWTSRVKVSSSILHECLKFPATIFQEIYWPSLQNVGLLFLVPLLIRFPISANNLIQDAPINPNLGIFCQHRRVENFRWI